MIRALAAALLTTLVVGCAGSYDQYIGAYNTHVDKETARITKEVDSINSMALAFDGTKVEQALMRALAMVSIGQLHPIPFTLQKPTQWEDVGMTLASQATNLMSWGMASLMVKWGFENTGTTFKGDAYLDNSFNRQNIQAWSGSPVMIGMAPAPDPLVVEPTVVIP